MGDGHEGDGDNGSNENGDEDENEDKEDSDEEEEDSDEESSTSSSSSDAEPVKLPSETLLQGRQRRRTAGKRMAALLDEEEVCHDECHSLYN